MWREFACIKGYYPKDWIFFSSFVVTRMYVLSYIEYAVNILLMLFIFFSSAG
jgi:hypothetical protein